MNALDLLKIDHRRIITLFEQAENKVKSESGEADHQPFDELARALRFHQKMLREVLYPELEKRNEGAFTALPIADDASLDHLLDNIERAQGADLSSQFAEMKDLWRNHAEQAELRLFPAVERLLGSGKLLELFYEMDEIRSRQSGHDSAIYPASRLGPKV